MGSFLVKDVVLGAKDATGAEIIDVYSRADGIYAVYRTRQRVVVQYADDDQGSLAGEQRKKVATLSGIRAEVASLLDSWRVPSTPVIKSKGTKDHATVRVYDRRVAGALVVALLGELEEARGLLVAARDELRALHHTRNETTYLMYGLGSASVLSLLSFWLAGAFSGDQAATTVATTTPSGPYWASVGFGVIGAFLSLAIALRGRQLPDNQQTWDNFLDPLLRVMIGAISGLVAYCVTQTGFFNTELFGAPTIANGHGELLSYVQVLIAIAAGFSERFADSTLGAVTSRIVKDPGGTEPAPPAAPPGSPPANTRTPPAEQPAAPDPEDLIDGGPYDQPANSGPIGPVTDDVELPPARGGVVQS